jgi:hypothetical protein
MQEQPVQQEIQERQVHPELLEQLVQLVLLDLPDL